MNQEKLRRIVEIAAGTRPFVMGVALGKSPKNFVIGDLCTERDQVVGRPFSGALGEIFTQILAALKCTAEECHVTYLVKACVKQGTLTEKEIEETWLPIARHEFALSGCEKVVAVGKIARMYAGYISVKPANLPEPPRPRWADRIVNAWRVLRG